MAVSPIGNIMRFRAISGSQSLGIASMVFLVPQTQPQILSVHPSTLVSALCAPRGQGIHLPGAVGTRWHLNPFTYWYKYPHCCDFKASRMLLGVTQDHQINVEMIQHLRSVWNSGDGLSTQVSWKAVQIVKPTRGCVFVLACAKTKHWCRSMEVALTCHFSERITFWIPAAPRFAHSGDALWAVPTLGCWGDQSPRW